MEVLIDTGSHNNFIQECLVDQLGLQSVPALRFFVYIGNGQFLVCDQICAIVPLILYGHEFLVDLYVLPICRLDIVLGMQWLHTLGPCVHDHEALTMEFTWNGKRVCLVGNLVTKPRQVSYNRLCALLQSTAVSYLYALQVIDSTTPTTNLDQWVELSSLFLHYLQLGSNSSRIIRLFLPHLRVCLHFTLLITVFIYNQGCLQLMFEPIVIHISRKTPWRRLFKNFLIINSFVQALALILLRCC